MTLGWPWPILQQGQIWSLMLLYGEKLLESHLMEETYSKWPEWQKVYCLPLPRGYIHVYKNRQKYVQNQTSKIFFFKLQQMGKVTRPFGWHQSFVHKGLSAPAPGLYTCGKTLKNVYKIRIQRDCFETCNRWSKWCNKWSKWSGLSVDIKTLSPRDCLLLAWGYIHAWKHSKICIKSDFKVIFFKTCNKWSKW